MQPSQGPRAEGLAVLAKLKSRGLGLWLGTCAVWGLQGAWRWAKLNSCGLGVGAGGWGLGRLGAGGWVGAGPRAKRLVDVLILYRKKQSC